MWLFFLLACNDSPPEQTADSPEWSVSEKITLSRMRLTGAATPDPSNRLSQNGDAQRLGEELFFDAGLSPAGISCAQCHDPDMHFTDGRTLGEGVESLGRHVPGIVGNTDGAWYFWDGRVDSIWAQAAGPVESAKEMGSDRAFVFHRVREGYRREYEQLGREFPDVPGVPMHASPRVDGLEQAWTDMTEVQKKAVNEVFVNSVKSIGAFEQTLLPKETVFDRYVDAVMAGDLSGGDTLSDTEIRGLRLFIRKGNCSSCHHGEHFTDRAFHNLGIPEPVAYDPGRQAGAALVLQSEFRCGTELNDALDCPELRYLNPNFPDFKAGFKTPSLRYVGQTGPYMHNGVFDTLDEVLEFYSDLPGEPPAGHRELTLKPLGFSVDEKSDLIAFLKSLSGDAVYAKRR